MAERGAQPGNDNASRNKPWRAALDRAIAQDDGKRLRAAAEKLLDCARDGEPWAVKEIADRLDGKAPVSIDLTGSLALRKAADLSDDELAAIANASGSAQT